LRQAREAKSLQLDEAARITRIGKMYLKALEEDDFARLPNRAYVKGFLRVYASLLGLSGDEMVALFDSDCLSQEALPLSEGQKNLLDTGETKSFLPRTIWMPVVLLALVIGVAYLAGRNGEERSAVEQGPLAPNVAAIQPLRSTASILTVPVKPLSQPVAVPKPIAESPPAKVQPVRRSEPRQPRQGIVLRLVVKEDGWLNMAIDGNLSKRYDLKTGDVIEWKGERFFTLDLGNAGGVEAEFNGRHLKAFGAKGDTAHVVLKGNGV
jgi:hypothetical protein